MRDNKSYTNIAKGMQTERRYIYSSPESVGAGYPNLTYCGDGDGNLWGQLYLQLGTVSIESLRLCDFWKKENLNDGFAIESKEYSGIDHVGILTDQEFINDVLSILQYL